MRKRLLTLVACVLLTTILFVNASAIDVNSSISDLSYSIASIDAMTGELLTNLQNMLVGIANDVQMKLASNISLGAPFKTLSISSSLFQSSNESSTILLYPIYCDGNIKYIITAIRINGKYSFTIDTDIAEELDEYVKNKTDNNYVLCVEENDKGYRLFAVEEENETIDLCSSYVIGNTENVTIDYNTCLANSSRASRTVPFYIDKNNILINITQYFTQMQNRSINGDISLSVPTIGQGSYTICWAASTACMTNYINGDSFTAKSIIDDYRSDTGVNTPYSTITYEYFSQTFFKHYFSYSSRYTILENGPLKNFITDSIDDGNPIIMSSYFENDTDYDGTGYHITVLYGYIDTSSDDYVNIRFMDPYGGTSHEGSKRIGYFSSINSFYAYTWGGSSNVRLWKTAIKL